MCLAIPGKVVKVDAEKGTATVDYEVEQREAGTVLVPDVTVGDYVLVQAKMIVQVVPEQQALDALAAIHEADERREKWAPGGTGGVSGDRGGRDA